ncbi:MAG: TetR/AcrR family transcriptional regulator [Bacteroidetes bacterium]|nr:MAG: TetR/AcrR family transcriptional regulator [Bacteroidota bacterium]
MLTDRQIEIIDKSINIIAINGIQGLTIKNLSKEIGISEPAIYRHFESKTDILLAILDNFQEMSMFMNEVIKDMDATAIDKIEFMFSKVIDVFSKEPAHISVVFSEELFKNEKILKDKIVEIMEVKENVVEDIIYEGQKKGEVRTDIDNKTLALIVIGALRFRIKRWDLKEHHKDLQNEANELVKALKSILQN